MVKKHLTKLEKEWRNLEIGEMQEANPQIKTNDYEQYEGYDLLDYDDTENE